MAAIGAGDGIIELLALIGIPLKWAPCPPFGSLTHRRRPRHFRDRGIALAVDIEHVVGLADPQSVIARHISEKSRVRIGSNPNPSAIQFQKCTIAGPNTNAT